MKKITIDQVHKGINLIIRVSLLLAVVGGIFRGDWSLIFATSLIFIATYLPSLFERRYKIHLPVEFELIIILFIYASLFLGEIRGYYTLFWWWDVILHTSSGIAIGFVGFLIVYILYYKNKIETKPIWAAVFAFCFAMAIGAVWEIFEFSMDQFFGLNMQKSGLVDTMWDLIVDALGALFTSLVGYYYLKGKKVSLFNRFMSKFLKENEKVFG